jgi:hypothetical protein
VCDGGPSPSTRALVINPDGTANQIEGGAIQATSWTVKERVRFDRYKVTSDTWETYPILRPILRFSEVPASRRRLPARRRQPATRSRGMRTGPQLWQRSPTRCQTRWVFVCALCLTAEQIVAAMP